MENKELRLVITRLIRASTEGMFQSLVLEPSGEDLSHARDFDIGDDPRRIEALPTFERGHITVYERNVEVGANLYFLIDCSASLQFGSGNITKYDFSVGLAAAICRACLGEGNRFLIISFSDHNEYESGFVNSETALEEKLDEMRRHKTKSKSTNLKNALKHFCLNFQDQHFGKPSIVFILSDFVFVPDFISELRQISEQTDTVAIFINDPAELALPKPRFGLVRLIDSETSKSFIARAPKSAIDTMAPILKRCEVDWLEVNTGQNLGKALDNLAELFEKKSEG